LSTALPVRETPYRGTPVEYWAEATLPEGETRTVLEQLFAVRRGDTFGLLGAIGADCAGAVAFLEPGLTPTAGLATAEPLDDRALAGAVAALPTHPLGADRDVRVSLGGLQAKLLVSMTTDGRWSRPAHGAPSTHIVKPDPAAYPGLVATEAFTLRLASRAGIDAAEGRMVDIGDRPALIVTRFDRVRDGTTVRRIHQEDACSALGIGPGSAQKYQSLAPASPTLARIAEVLSTHGTDVPAGLAALARAVTVRTAVGDTDGHARNYGFLHHGATVQLAPLYDAAPTFHFARTRQVGLWIGGQAMLTAITVRHLTDEFRSWGVPSRLAAQLGPATLERMRDVVSDAAADVPDVDAAVVDDVGRRILALLDGSVSPST
jgi:serine/threonine-protein kinase HipA